MAEEFNLKQSMQDAKKRRLEEIADLESCSKPLSELVAIERFTIIDVVAESYATSFTPHSEARFGGSSLIYRGGFTSKLVLKVLPDNQDIPIRTINFDGNSVVRAGDYISAQIPKYEKKIVGSGLQSGSCDDRVFYIDRVFNPEECAIELTLLSADGKVLRKDRSVNYKDFVEQ